MGEDLDWETKRVANRKVGSTLGLWVDEGFIRGGVRAIGERSQGEGMALSQRFIAFLVKAWSAT